MRIDSSPRRLARATSYALWSPADRWHQTPSNRGFCFVTYCLRNTVCGENQDRAVGTSLICSIKIAPRSRRLSTTSGYAPLRDGHISVRRKWPALFNNADSAVYPGTKTTRVGQRICMLRLQCRIDFQHFNIKITVCPASGWLKSTVMESPLICGSRQASHCHPLR